MKKSVLVILSFVFGFLPLFFTAPAFAMESAPSDEIFQPDEGRSVSSLPIRVGQRWVGTYACSQGKTSLMIMMDSVARTWDPNVYNVQGSFNFNYGYGQCVGQFVLRGEYDSKTRALNFLPGEWVSNSCGYGSVPLEGAISPDGKRYSGRIMLNSCGNFDVRVIN